MKAFSGSLESPPPPFSVRRWGRIGSACPPCRSTHAQHPPFASAMHETERVHMLSYVGSFAIFGFILCTCAHHFRSCDSPTPPTCCYLYRNSLMGGNQSTPDAPHQSPAADPSVPSPTPVNQPPSDVQTPPADPGITVVNAGKSSTRPLHVGNGNVETSR